jgi:hypothetical protein
MDGSLGEAIGLVAAVAALAGAITRYSAVLAGAATQVEIERATAAGFFVGLAAAIPAAVVTLT